MGQNHKFAGIVGDFSQTNKVSKDREDLNYTINRLLEYMGLKSL